MTWNIEGLKKYTHDGSLKGYFEQFDIIGLLESWSNFQGEFDSFLQDYTCFDYVRPRTGGFRNSGGVNVFVKNTLMHKYEVTRIFSNFKNCVFLYFKTSMFHTQNIIICFTYISPEGSVIYNDSDEKDGVKILENYLITVKAEYPYCHLFIAGDFNARCKTFLDFIPDDNLEQVFGDISYPGDSFEMPRNTKDKHTYNSFGKSLVQMCCLLDIHILNGRISGDEKGEFTCIANEGASVVDYNIASTDLFENISLFRVEDRDESVHFPLKCIISLQEQNQRAVLNVDEDERECQPYVKYKWDDLKSTSFLNKFRDTLNSNYDRIVTSINENTEEANAMFLQLFYSAAEFMKVSNNNGIRRNIFSNKPWWDTVCEAMRNRKMQALRLFRIIGTRCNLRNYINLRNRFKGICRDKKRAYECQNRQKLVQARNIPSKFWNLLKGRTVSIKSKISPMQWYNYFKELFYFHEQGENGEQTFAPADSADCLNDPFSVSEVKAALRKLKTGKSPGSDGLVAELFQHTSALIAPLLTIFFNRIFQTGNVPESWTQSIICPIHKNGSQHNPDTFRGISLINIVSKVFMTVLTSRLTQWCDEHNIIDEAQGGFRRGYSTIDNIFILQSIAQKYLSKEGGRFYCLFIDFSKAFDRIQHNQLFRSLAKKGIHGNFLNILKSMYGKLSACVKTEQGLTSYFPCHIGTRQGCVSSPLIFTLFINDLVTLMRENCRNGIFITQDVPEILCLLFADDVAGLLHPYNDNLILLINFADLQECN